jgi:hypothetical protein
VQQHPDKPWNWYELSCNPNITREIVQNHLDKPWDWGGLSQNPFTMACECYIQKHLAIKAAKWFCTSDLKRELIEKMWHPKNLDKLQNHWGA